MRAFILAIISLIALPNCDDTVPALDYCEFDDLVVSISPDVFKNHIIMAGKLP